MNFPSQIDEFKRFLKNRLEKEASLYFDTNEAKLLADKRQRHPLKLSFLCPFDYSYVLPIALFSVGYDCIFMKVRHHKYIFIQNLLFRLLVCNTLYYASLIDYNKFYNNIYIKLLKHK